MRKTDALMERVVSRLEELKRSLQKGEAADFLSLLDVAGRLPMYSARNMVLIQAQRPGATTVAGIKRWNQMGRKVKRGERGIAILAPILKRVEVREEETGEVRVEERLVGFRTVYVFDVSQTEPIGPQDPLKRPGRVVAGAEIYNWIRSRSPVPVVEEWLPNGTMGYTDGVRIFISPALPPTAKAEILLHELAHSWLHSDEVDLPVEVAELEAEATAYAVGRNLGLEMKNSRAYILHWRGTVQGLEASLERITKAAREMLEVLGQPGQPLGEEEVEA